jgi:Domain of unknown function (DUF6531)
MAVSGPGVAGAVGTAPAVTATMLPTGVVRVSWLAVPGATGYVVGYTSSNGLNPSPSGTTTVSAASLAYDYTPPDWACTVSGCRFWIAATSAQGQGPWSNDTAYVVGKAPGAPVGLSVAWSGDHIIASWESPTFVGLPALSSYVVEVTLYGNGWETRQRYTSSTSLDISQVLLSLDGPNPCGGNGCSVRVFALNAAGIAGDLSERATIADRPPGAPTNVVLSWSNDNVIASWDAPADPGVPVRLSYEVEVTYFDGTWNTRLVGQQATSFDLSWWFSSYRGFKPNCAEYGCSVRVSASNGTTLGNPSERATIVGRPPGAPTNLALAWSADHVIASWTPPVDVGIPALGSYTLEVSYFETTWKTNEIYVQATGSPSFDVSAWFLNYRGFNPDCATYGCSVRVVAVGFNSTSNSGPSARVLIGPPPGIVSPGSVSSLTASRATSGFVNLSWSASGTGATVQGYDITRADGARTGRTWPDSAAQVICPLVSGCSYTVAAWNAAGVSSDSGPVSVASLAPPEPPTNLATSMQPDGRVLLTWSASPTGTPPRAYRVVNGLGANRPEPGPSGYQTCPVVGRCVLKVYAVNEHGESAPAEIEVVMPVPASPIGVQKVENSDGTTTLSWTAPSNVGLPPVIGYRLYWSARPPGAASQLPTVFSPRLGPTTTSASFTCPFRLVGASASCQVAVVAINPYGESNKRFGVPSSWLRGFFKARTTVADPVSTATGDFSHDETDLVAPSGVAGLSYGRWYNSSDDRVTANGLGWIGSFGETLRRAPDGTLAYAEPSGRVSSFPSNGAGGWTHPVGVEADVLIRSDNSFALSYSDGSITEFDTTGRIESMTFWDGQSVTIARNVAGAPALVTASSGATRRRQLGRVRLVYV